ncbi:breast carcinoma-amplified sequence 4 isoform X1 [Callithrix jacchus]|uniref:breast carcinoma-amplified sequence 4 isoform X1 n=1 Tax=Callithrix jacchus TaxID=9483 RepID=UPI0023DD2CF7|nr:breast carcinoma-amplified sequence 4 isoform X1 [Callithrix jacchus]
MQRAGGGALRPGRNYGLPGSLRQLDLAALLMLLVDADRQEPMRSGARELALFLTPEPGAEAKEVEETIEGMLLRLEEFCSLTHLIRSDTSQILEGHIPVLKAKLTEMRGIYAKVDRLEAFVKMVGRHVAFLEADVLQAERDHGAFPQALRRWLGSGGLPSFGNFAENDVLQIHPCPYNRHELIISDCCIIFHGVYVPHFPNPVYHQWAFGLIPGLCYCKQCCNKHSCACVLIVE